MKASQYLIPVVVLVALAAADSTTGYLRRRAAGLFTPQDVRFLAKPRTLSPFSAIDLDGRNVSVAAWRGKVAIVNFWATWCFPCRREIPALVLLKKKFKSDLIVVGILEDGASTPFVRAFGTSLGVNYPIVRTSAEIEQSFAPVLVFPTTYIVDPTGRIVSIHVGEINPTLVDREVQALLKLADSESRSSSP